MCRAREHEWASFVWIRLFGSFRARVVYSRAYVIFAWSSWVSCRARVIFAWACFVSCRAHLVWMGALSSIRFVWARDKLVEHISLIRQFLHETIVYVRRRIQSIRMKFRVFRKDNSYWFNLFRIVNILLPWHFASMTWVLWMICWATHNSRF